MSEIVTEDTAEPSAELVSKVEAGLSKIETPDAPTGQEPEPTPEPGAELKPEPTPEPEPKVEEPAGEPEPEPEPEVPAGKTESEVKAGVEIAPTLPENYIRAAIHQGWKDEDIKEFFKANPEQARKTFANIYESTNRMSNQFAELGKATHEKVAEPKKSILPGSAPKAETVESEYKGIDIEVIKAQYGENDPIVALMQQMDNSARQSHDKINKLIEAQTQAPETNREADYALEQQIGVFFNDPVLKPFTELYGEGNNWDEDITGKQARKRWEVVQMADRMIAGAMLQGKELSIPNALELSHLAITAPEKEKVIREDLKAKATKRQKGISLKPSTAKAASVKQTDAQKEQALQDRVAGKLVKAFA